MVLPVLVVAGARAGLGAGAGRDPGARRRRRAGDRPGRGPRRRPGLGRGPRAAGSHRTARRITVQRRRRHRRRPGAGRRCGGPRGLFGFLPGVDVRRRGGRRPGAADEPGAGDRRPGGRAAAAPRVLAVGAGRRCWPSPRCSCRRSAASSRTSAGSSPRPTWRRWPAPVRCRRVRTPARGRPTVGRPQRRPAGRVLSRRGGGGHGRVTRSRVVLGPDGSRSRRAARAVARSRVRLSGRRCQRPGQRRRVSGWAAAASGRARRRVRRRGRLGRVGRADRLRAGRCRSGCGRGRSCGRSAAGARWRSVPVVVRPPGVSPRRAAPRASRACAASSWSCGSALARRIPERTSSRPMMKTSRAAAPARNTTSVGIVDAAAEERRLVVGAAGEHRDERCRRRAGSG